MILPTTTVVFIGIDLVFTLAKPSEKVQKEVLYTCYSRSCKEIARKHDILFCVVCRRGFHTKCCDPQLNYAFVCQYEWQCPNCKLCVKCRVHEDEEVVVICDCCDRAFHLECTLEKYKEVPPGKWFCENCACCLVCRKRLNPEEAKVQKTTHKEVHGTICPNCAKLYIRGNEFLLDICDCCSYAIFKSIRCNFCDSVVHMTCINESGVCKNCESLENGYQNPDEA